MEEGNKVATRWRVTGTHLGPIAVPDGELEPTGERFDVELGEFVEVRDGRIHRSVSYWDDAALQAQLGIG